MQTNSKSVAPRRTQARKMQQHRDTSPTENDLFLATTATPRDAAQAEKKKQPMRRLLAAQPKTNPYQTNQTGFSTLQNTAKRQTSKE